MKIVDGNKACSNIAYLFSEVCAIYPITPSSPMAENIDALSHSDKLNLYNSHPAVIEMESELGAAGAFHGALMSGSLASTFTASQGLLLMIPNMYKIAGEMWPGVIHCASRSLATHALSIFGDHQDVYAARATGFCMLASSSVEDAASLAAVAHLSAIKGSLPFIHFFDGFRTSHELNTIDEIDESELLKLIDKDALERFRKRSLNVDSNIMYGSSQTEDVYFQCMEARNTAYLNMPDIVNDYMQKVGVLTKKEYKPFNYYGSSRPKNVIVAMGSVCETIKRVIDYEMTMGNDSIGLIEVHLYRPFSSRYLKEVLPSSTKNMAVLDRTKEAGSVGEPLYLDVASALKGLDINIVGGRYGLSSKDTTPSHIKAVYNMLDSNIVNDFTIGINDDVTYLSLPEVNYNVPLDVQEFKIYGFGSDGMVGSSKDILNIINKETGKYVQGYFEYDSKKSGGVTISHLRISDNKISAPYYVQNPELVVVTKDKYFLRYDILRDIKDGGTLLVNTILNNTEFDRFLPLEIKNIIKEKHINVLLINAEKIAFENNIKGKISKIMEVNILNLLKIANAKDIVINSIKTKFASKGEDIVNNNINATLSALDKVNKFELITDDSDSSMNTENDIYDVMMNRKGGTLSVSDVLPISDGHLPCGLSKREKRAISSLTVKWNKEKCIECGLCTMVCPHAAIRAFNFKGDADGKLLIGKDGYSFKIGISNEDCSGCGLCASICPTHSLSLEEKVASSSDLFDKENDKLFSKGSIKGLCMEKPRFEFSGACAGCGETSYIRILTQLLQDKLIIANATGCSSIYGNSSPCTPYTIPWANSLFEDNAEFAYGMYISYKQKKDQIRNVISSSLDAVDTDTRKLFEEYLENEDDFDKTYKIKGLLDDNKIPKELSFLKDYIPARSIWAIGGDGWAYDIGYNGIDHILHSNENINILVLDTEVYSNTGGQASKATNKGAVAEFADYGKKTNKKDLFKIASGIENVYVASICLGANMMQTINAFKEAEEHKGPSIIIAYCPCIEHGISKGLGNSLNEAKLAVECGYTILMRSCNNHLIIDSAEPNFDKYHELLDNEVRFKSLKLKDASYAEDILQRQKGYAIKRYEYYKSMQNKNSQ